MRSMLSNDAIWEQAFQDEQAGLVPTEYTEQESDIEALM